MLAPLQEFGCCAACQLRLTNERDGDRYKQLSSSPSTAQCSVCVGILQPSFMEETVDAIVKEVTDQGYDFKQFSLNITVPAAVRLRSYCAFLNASARLAEGSLDDTQRPNEDVLLDAKAVIKWMITTKLEQRLGGTHAPLTAPFHITVLFSHDPATEHLTAVSPSLGLNSRKIRRGRSGQHAWKKAKVEVVHTPSQAGLQSALDTLPLTQLAQTVPFPLPAAPCVKPSMRVQFKNDALFISGNYRKYSRVLSQSPFILPNGTRKTETSVQELICEPLLETFGCQEYKFHSAGREDVDVKMLGMGRTFVCELLNPCKTFSVCTAEVFERLQNDINDKAQGLVNIHSLHLGNKGYMQILKDGEQTKQKSYRCVCWASRDVTPEELRRCLDDKAPLTVQQDTPLRVLHRRTSSIRARTAYSLTTQWLSKRYFTLELRTQAGMYIKEFVHGDRGRSVPNVSSLLGDCEVDIVQLDVLNLHRSDGSLWVIQPPAATTAIASAASAASAASSSSSSS